MVVGRDSSEGLETDSSVLRYRGKERKSYGLSEQLEYKSQH